MDADLQRLRLDKEQSTTDENGSLDGSAALFGKAKMPKMPYFEEDKDCMDSYLNRFERFVEIQGWKRESLAICLSALLKGKALDVYSRLPPEQAGDYDTLKQALLKWYQLSEDGFKRKFREATPETGESPMQFLTRLASYLQRWVELAKVRQTFDGLSTLMIKEQYLSVCLPPLALFLKERSPTSMEELGQLAEQYCEAHHEVKAYRRNDSDTQHRGRLTTPQDSVKRCHKCGSRFHLIKKCRAGNEERQVQFTPSTSATKTCFICGKKGHIARNCLSRQKTAAMKSLGGDTDVINRNDRNAQAGAEGGSCKPPNQQMCNALHVEQDQELELKCGCKLPVIADACQNGGSHRMPVTD